MERTHMKLPRILFVLLAALLTLSCSFPTFAISENDLSSDEEVVSEPVSTLENGSAMPPDENTAPEPTTVSENQPEILSEDDSFSEPAYAAMPESQPETPAADKKPGFSATLTHCSDGYVVKGCFTEFLPDTDLVQPQSSLDGENWQDCGVDWNLSSLGQEDFQYGLQNQICLYESFEPLKSYLAGELDRFYLRLRIATESGMNYETEAAVIERGETMPVPEEITISASFAPNIFSFEATVSGSFFSCGKYQLTVQADDSPGEIAAYLPDTLPVQVELKKGRQHFTECIINCPVTWKPLSLSGLTAGESVSIQDAAEEIVIPAGTVLSTPMGDFTLDEPLRLETSWWNTDEVLLVLNVISENENPTGVLAINNNELKMAFVLKPTGATAIRAYTLVDGESEWTELSGLPLLNAVNAQPLTANSGYTDILTSSQEPYRSYLAAEFSEEPSKPFFVGLKIEGGVYDGRELILACPDTYELPPDLHVGGSGGNEGNAGNGNRDDSTEEGQRPNLPKPRPDKASAKEPQANTPAAAPADDSENKNDPSATGAQTGTATIPADANSKSQSGPSKISANADAKQQNGSPKISTDTDAKPQTETAGISSDNETLEIQIKAEGNLLAGTNAKSQTDTSEISSVPDAQPQKKQASPVMLFLAAAVAIGGVCLCVGSAGARRALKAWLQTHRSNRKTARS